MTATTAHPGFGYNGSGGEGEVGVRLMQVPPKLRIAAAGRLMGEHGADPILAAQRFLESAVQLRVDLDLMWCTAQEHPGMGGAGGVGDMTHVRQVVLAVIGSGRTAMLFVSGAERRGKPWPGTAKLRTLAGVALAEAHKERVRLVEHACEQVGRTGADGRARAILAQALLEPRETDGAQALVAAGFLRLGDLVYMRRPLPRAGPGRALEEAADPEWPDGLRVASIASLIQGGHSPERVDAWLSQALERSYIDTQDCPELCGMRGMADVLESHRAVGVFDPSLWWIVFDRDQTACACMLLSPCPEQDSVELVYLGIGPEARGKGLGSKLLAFGLRSLYDKVLSPDEHAGHPRVSGSGGVTCAVDTRNTPAMKLYRRAGFERFGLRVPFVRSVHCTSGRASA